MRRLVIYAMHVLCSRCWVYVPWNTQRANTLINQLFHQHEKWPIKWQLNYLHTLYNLVCGDLFLYHVFHLRWGFPLLSLSSRSYFKLSRPYHCGDKGCCYVYTVLSLINVSVSQYTLFLNRAFSRMLCHYEATICITLSMECMNCIKLHGVHELHGAHELHGVHELLKWQMTDWSNV